MLQNWLKKIPFQNDQFEKYQLGNHINFYGVDFPDLKKIKIAIIGVEVKEANAARAELYELAHHFPNVQIADLGNVRKKENSFIIPILKELLGSGICTILIGKKETWTKAQQQGHRQTAKYTNNWLSIDDRVRFDKDFKGNRTVVGGQRHLTKSSDLERLEKENLEYYSLGRCRTNLKDTEPAIRNADFVSIHLATLKSIEAPAQAGISPSGFFLEEACQLTYYAGMSDKINSIGIYGFEVQKEDQLTIKTVAQLIWYFLDGFHNRKQDYPVSMEEMAEYIVHLKKEDILVTFWKSLKSGRWWLQLPDKKTKNRLTPCAYEDYQQAGQGEISDRLLTILKKR